MNAGLLNELKALYRDGFPEESAQDADEFFSHIREENAVYIREEGRMVSAGYFTKKPAHLFGSDTAVPFLSGLSTSRDLRGQGRIGEVLHRIISRLYAQGESVCMLYPFNHTYYLRHGFCDVSFCAEKTAAGDRSLSPAITDVTEQDLERFAAIEADFARDFDNRLTYTKARIAAKIRAYSFGAARLYAWGDEAYCIAEGDRVLHYAAINPTKLFTDGRLGGFSYFDFQDGTKPFAQGRIVNAIKALQQAVYLPEVKKTVVLQIIDPMIRENNIIAEVLVENGRAMVRQTTKSPDLVLDIGALCRLVFCGDGQLVKTQTNYFGDLW